MSECKKRDSVVPILVSWEGPVRVADVTHFDVNKFAEFIQIWRRFIWNDIPDEVIESLDGGDLLRTLHRKHKLFISFCNHETVKFPTPPIIMPHCIKGIEWDCLLNQNVSVC